MMNKKPSIPIRKEKYVPTVMEVMMRKCDVSQTELAREIGVYQATISNALRGHIKLTDLQLKGIARRLNVADPSVLLSPYHPERDYESN